MINKVNDDIFAFGDDMVLRIFEVEHRINFSSEATRQSLLQEQPFYQRINFLGNSCNQLVVIIFQR